MERSEEKARTRDAGTGSAPGQKLPYRRPELTKHELLTEITLAVQCSVTVPPCVSPQDMMY